MDVITGTYVRKPLYVEAVRVTNRNIDAVAEWCQGEVQVQRSSGKRKKKFIKVDVHLPRSERQTKALLGDWVLHTERGGFKVYTDKAFSESFDAVDPETKEAKEIQRNPSQPSGTVGAQVTIVDKTSSAPDAESFVGVQAGGGERIEEATPDQKGFANPEVNDVAPPPMEQGVPTTPQGEPMEFVEATPENIIQAATENDQARAATELAEKRVKELTDATLTEAEELRQEAEVGPAKTSDVVEEPDLVSKHNEREALAKEAPLITEAEAREALGVPPKPEERMVPVAPELLEDSITEPAVVDSPTAPPTEDTPGPPTEVDGKRVLTQKEQAQMGPEKVRVLLSSGSAVLVQDLVETS